MPYTLPNFNLTVNFWHNLDLTLGPPAGAPDVVTVGNLQYGRKNDSGWGGGSTLLVPIGTNIHHPYSVNPNFQTDVCECPAGSGIWYVVWGVAFVGRGFANEYWVAELFPAMNWTSDGAWDWPDPIP